MTSLKSDFLRVLTERGFVHQATDPEGLDALAKSGELVAYVGYDATADSLHVGSLISIMMLRWLQKTGGTPIALMGGGTTKVGDPSGKDESRKLLSEAEIQSNIDKIGAIFANFLEFGPASQGGATAMMANNADWLDALAYIPLLRDIGRHFTINRMLTFDSVKLRLEREQPLTFLEFNYMILQAYDFLELSRRHGCRLQMGGSDQWGNIVNGIELARRVEGRELFGLTCPLLTTASGQKMGKTAAGAVWLSPERLGDFEYWQYWRNTEDADVGRFLKLFTELPLDEVARLEALGGSEINEAKKVLANEATALCRGRAAAEAAAETARRTFEEGGLDEGLPTVTVERARLAAGLPAYELFREAGLAASNGEARRLIKGGGARLNDARIEAEDLRVSLDDLGAEGVVKLSAGRKRHALVRAG
ncbi:tyrosyl-tRNA synthetase [Tistlia consotensis]|uniref:Tyrosine--tRNA ligase n=1 Tax=Tistlia consotensis USBA 355 TaxID=560819 RepID=A0A1Y6C1V0_9PROT|nr:tyrosine--tRNA ligase [Tistlia consotensis]SMF41010.1 tyrosyl-tRNA synthetase [Tistlia consotensis USBA 355]SNR74211.1 tyrosyl-tRNA synthetase [Tistlia consotensis]